MDFGEDSGNKKYKNKEVNKEILNGLKQRFRKFSSITFEENLWTFP